MFLGPKLGIRVRSIHLQITVYVNNLRKLKSSEGLRLGNFCKKEEDVS